MKKIIYTLNSILLAGSLLTSCSEEDFTTFGGEKSGIYIQQANSYTPAGIPIGFTDSVSYALSVYPESTEKIDVQIPVCIMGNIADYDRPFVMKIDEEKSTAVRGVHFEIDESTCFIPAGQPSARVNIYLLRHSDLVENTLRIEVYLEPNDQFTTELEHFKNSAQWNANAPEICGTRFKIMFNDQYASTFYWDAMGTGPFGEWSMSKEKRVNNIMGWSHDDWVRMKVQYNRFGYAARMLRKELQELADAGTPVIDDNGSYMQLGQSYQVDYSRYENN